MNKDEITDILNQEVRKAANSHVSQEDAHWNSISDARQQTKALQNICTSRRAGLKIRFDNLRHQSIKIELPLDPIQVTAALKKHQEMVVNEMENLLTWLGEVTEDLVRKDVRLVERTERVYTSPSEERNVRLERLFRLADLCGAREQLPSIDVLGEE